MVKRYIPKRGDIVWIDFDPIKGYEQGGRRPAVTISSELYNQISKRALFLPITSTIRGFVFEVLLTQEKTKGAILVDQVRSLDWSSRNISFIEMISPGTLKETEGKLLALIRE